MSAKSPRVFSRELKEAALRRILAGEKVKRWRRGWTSGPAHLGLAEPLRTWGPGGVARPGRLPKAARRWSNAQVGPHWCPAGAGGASREPWRTTVDETHSVTDGLGFRARRGLSRHGGTVDAQEGQHRGAKVAVR